jgi:orotate phosphoribosyltransferase
MRSEEILVLLRATGAVSEQHTVDHQGLHHLQLVRVCKALQFAPYTRKLCYEIVRHFLELDIHAVVAPTIGSIPVAVEVGRQLEARSIFLKGSESEPELYDGFELHDGERVVVVIDLLRTDRETEGAVALIRAAEARLIGIGAIIDARRERRSFAVKQVSAIQLADVPYSGAECPVCASQASRGESPMALR